MALSGTKFSQVADLIQADYQAVTGDTTTVWYKGRLRQAENAEQQRIVMVRPGGEIAEALEAGPTQNSVGLATQLKAKLDQIIANIYAADEEKAEAILDALVGSYQRVLGSAFVGGTYVWVTETEDGARHAAWGVLVRFTTQWRLKILGKSLATVNVSSVSTTGYFGAGDFSSDFSFEFSHMGGEQGCN